MGYLLISGEAVGVVSMKTAIIYDDMFLKHDPGPGHPESPQRLKVMMRAIKKSDFLRKKVLKIRKPRQASLEDLLYVHSPAHIRRIEEISRRGGGYITEDTVLNEYTYDTALMAAGGAIVAAEAVVKREARNAFALIRPPGHHSAFNRAWGFCFFNNVAIATRWLQNKKYVKKVLIVDIDAHHGDGTQETFYNDPNVLYFSIHQYGIFPGTGSVNEVGVRDGEGFTVNVPFPELTSDSAYEKAIDEILVPIAEQFKPDITMVSLGYDAHHMDPITLMGLTVQGYKKLVSKVIALSNKICNGKLTVVLEGGYNLEILPKVFLATISAMTGEEVVLEEDKFGVSDAEQKMAFQIIDRVKEVMSRYWSL